MRSLSSSGLSQGGRASWRPTELRDSKSSNQSMEAAVNERQNSYSQSAGPVNPFRRPSRDPMLGISGSQPLYVPPVQPQTSPLVPMMETLPPKQEVSKIPNYILYVSSLDKKCQSMMHFIKQHTPNIISIENVSDIQQKPEWLDGVPLLLDIKSKIVLRGTYAILATQYICEGRKLSSAQVLPISPISSNSELNSPPSTPKDDIPMPPPDLTSNGNQVETPPKIKKSSPQKSEKKSNSGSTKVNEDQIQKLLEKRKQSSNIQPTPS